MANLINIMYEHAGQKYDIQAEDMGQESGELDLRIYKDGAIVFQRQTNYRDQVPRESSPLEHDRLVRDLMRKQLELLKRGIAAGKVK